MRARRTTRTQLVFIGHARTGRTTGSIIPEEKVDEVRGWIENYHKLTSCGGA